MSSLIAIKGYMDVLVGVLLTFSPSTIYDNPLTRVVASYTGLRIADASGSRGFNQAIACMTAAVGIAHVVAARSGPAVKPSILVMWGTLGVLNLAACAASRELGCAAVFSQGVYHLVLASVLHWSDPTAVKRV